MKKLVALISILMLTVGIIFAASVEGYVTDAENGEGIESAIVRFHFLDGDCPEGGTNGNGQNGGNNGNNGGNNGGYGINVYNATTDANGYYSIVDLPEGSYEARALKPHTYMPTLIEDITITEDVNVVDFALEGCNGTGSAKQLKVRHLINF
ncbi:MAG: carboxypeptidase regulatory-like domain-containing protein [Candidatus Cloacimonetes bacterium]|nr:carboxypeptidase regulatory-like domain-containing protein [Candidatus Cloacimonadota bacterium]